MVHMQTQAALRARMPAAGVICRSRSGHLAIVVGHKQPPGARELCFVDPSANMHRVRQHSNPQPQRRHGRRVVRVRADVPCVVPSGPVVAPPSRLHSYSRRQ